MSVYRTFSQLTGRQWDSSHRLPTPLLVGGWNFDLVRCRSQTLKMQRLCALWCFSPGWSCHINLTSLYPSARSGPVLTEIWDIIPLNLREIISLRIEFLCSVHFEKGIGASKSTQAMDLVYLKLYCIPTLHFVKPLWFWCSFIHFEDHFVPKWTLYKYCTLYTSSFKAYLWFSLREKCLECQL